MSESSSKKGVDHAGVVATNLLSMALFLAKSAQNSYTGWGIPKLAGNVLAGEINFNYNVFEWKGICVCVS